MDTQHTKLWVAENAVSRGKFTAKQTNKQKTKTNKQTKNPTLRNKKDIK